MNPFEALKWYYLDDCQSVAMGILESVFDRPAAEVMGISLEQAELDVEKFSRINEETIWLHGPVKVVSQSSATNSTPQAKQF